MGSNPIWSSKNNRKEEKKMLRLRLRLAYLQLNNIYTPVSESVDEADSKSVALSV